MFDVRLFWVSMRTLLILPEQPWSQMLRVAMPEKNRALDDLAQAEVAHTSSAQNSLINTSHVAHPATGGVSAILSSTREGKLRIVGKRH